MRMSLFLLVFMTMVGLGSFFSISVFKIYGVFKNTTTYTIALSLFIGLPLIFIITSLVSTKTYYTLNAWLNTLGSIWIGATLYIFISAFILAGLYFFIKNSDPKTLYSIGVGALTCVFLVVSYAIYNASHPRVTTVTIQNTALAPLWKNKKIVLFSDTHLGLIRQEAFAHKVARLVNAQNPDLVLMAGDMIDGPIIPYEQFSKPFSEIKATHGVFYTPGNHEWYNVEPEKFITTMSHITSALIDAKTETNDTQIIGINYASEAPEKTKERLQKTNFDPTKPSIAIMHDPKNNDALIESGVSLVVSGHTHCGQFWPFTFIVNSLYKDKTYGVRNIDGRTTITTCGIGTAQAPFRLGTTPEIMVITVES